MRVLLSSLQSAFTLRVPPLSFTAAALQRFTARGAGDTLPALLHETLPEGLQRTTHPTGIAPTASVAEPVELAPSDPVGLRVLPYRPAATWPEHRLVHPRVYDPFRAFPRRAAHLVALIHPRDPRD